MSSDPTTDERGLRADLLTPSVVAVPGANVEVELQILNTSAVIEQIQVNVLGVEVESAASEPATLTLFPDESARLLLRLRFPTQLASGTHTALLQVMGQSMRSIAECELIVDVPPVPDVAVALEPPLVRGAGRAEYTVAAENRGNTVLTLLVRATDADQRLRLGVDTPTLRLAPGETGTARITARHRRPLKGEPLEHVISVQAEQGAIIGMGTARFIQKPRITAGIVTIFTLVLILSLWAVAMFFGVRAALAGPPPTKAVPEGFSEGVGIEDFDAIAVGGTVTGRIVAASTARPLPRLTVEAFDGDGVLVTAAATDSEGVYQLGGLLPIEYRIRVRGTGVEDLWWPDAGSQADGEALFVAPSDVTSDIDAVVTGLGAEVGGRIIAGDDDPVEISVTLTAVDTLDVVDPVTVTAAADGTWTASGLVSPATYRIAAAAEGYDTVEVTQVVAPGEQLVVNTVRLPAAAGAIGGTVVDADGQPLGAVEVAVVRGDLSLSTVTPTAGVIGSFLVPDLPTPATYLVTYTAEGYSSETQAIRLGPGVSSTDLSVTLRPAFGTVTGRVTTGAGQAIGGATVTVAGEGIEVATSTFTSGTIGSYRVGELPMPGIYTVTVEFDGYRRETLQVSLTREAPVATANTELTASLGRVSGIVIDSATEAGIGAVVIVVSDGLNTWETTTASAPAAAIGRFSVADLPPGAYTVTASYPGYTDTTVLQVVTAGVESSVTAELVAS